MHTYCAYAIVESETCERFNFKDYPTFERARAEAFRLGNVFHYTLNVYGIDPQGILHLLDDNANMGERGR